MARARRTTRSRAAWAKQPATDCGHCRAKQTLAPTADTHDDSAGARVRVWRCSACDYTEGRPDPKEE
jgi:hypothetical protein